MSGKSFININGIRIKVSNIKNYGVSSRIDQIEVDVETNMLEDSVNLLTLLSIGGKAFPNIKKKDKKVKYLYLTTYQKDNYTWDEDEINIEKVLSELDNI
jgi:hypothetical protein